MFPPGTAAARIIMSAKPKSISAAPIKSATFDAKDPKSPTRNKRYQMTKMPCQVKYEKTNKGTFMLLDGLPIAMRPNTAKSGGWLPLIPGFSVTQRGSKVEIKCQLH